MSAVLLGEAAVVAPKSMLEALETDDPHAALLAIGRQASQRAEYLTQQWQLEIQVELPEILRNLPNKDDLDSHPVATAIACTDSILHSLTKIATGGSQASQEIKNLEQEKRDLEEHAQDVETALILRRASDTAAQAVSAARYPEAAAAIQEYTMQKAGRLTDRAKAYAGEYTVTQLESTQRSLQKTLLEHYQKAVQESDVMTLGKLTPLVQMVQMEQAAVELYLRFLKDTLSRELSQAVAVHAEDKKKPPYVPMARAYNAAVTILRHHLPMVSHCLHKAAGDVAVVQLVHVQVEQAVSPLFQEYIRSRQSSSVNIIYMFKLWSTNIVSPCLRRVWVLQRKISSREKSFCIVFSDCEKTNCRFTNTSQFVNIRNSYFSINS